MRVITQCLVRASLVGMLVGTWLLGCSSSSPPAECLDSDRDGHASATCGGEDCDDGDPLVHPGGSEVCGNARDDDCAPGTPDLFDADGDGHTCDLDCDDTDPYVRPGRSEVACNALDDDCDPATPDLPDLDKDGASSCAEDCDDEDPGVHPGAPEDCGNARDDDCDLAVDCADPDCAAQPACEPCGNGDPDPGEECDDGNACGLDGCRECVYEPTVVLNSLQLTEGRGFDLDDRDGDGDLYTGIDNRLAGEELLVEAVNEIIRSNLEAGLAIPLLTFGQLDNVPYEGIGTPGYEEDAEIEIASYGGLDPACPPEAAPVPWILWPYSPWPLYSDADSFQACAPRSLITEADDSANGIYAANTNPGQPEAPFLHLHAPTLSLAMGSMGALELRNATAEAQVLNDERELIGLSDGVLGGVLSASVLLGVDTSQSTEGRCPTALHVLLAIVGQPDQDAEGNGQRDTIDFSCPMGCFMACSQFALTIDGCTDDETGETIPGPDCVLDPRIGDGYSAGFTFGAPYVRVTDQASRAAYCP